MFCKKSFGILVVLFRKEKVYDTNEIATRTLRGPASYAKPWLRVLSLQGSFTHQLLNAVRFLNVKLSQTTWSYDSMRMVAIFSSFLPPLRHPYAFVSSWPRETLRFLRVKKRGEDTVRKRLRLLFRRYPMQCEDFTGSYAVEEKRAEIQTNGRSAHVFEKFWNHAAKSELCSDVALSTWQTKIGFSKTNDEGEIIASAYRFADSENHWRNSYSSFLDVSFFSAWLILSYRLLQQKCSPRLITCVVDGARTTLLLYLRQ